MFLIGMLCLVLVIPHSLTLFALVGNFGLLNTFAIFLNCFAPLIPVQICGILLRVVGCGLRSICFFFLNFALSPKTTLFRKDSCTTFGTLIVKRRPRSGFISLLAFARSFIRLGLTHFQLVLQPLVLCARWHNM